MQVTEKIRLRQEIKERNNYIKTAEKTSVVFFDVLKGLLKEFHKIRKEFVWDFYKKPCNLA